MLLKFYKSWVKNTADDTLWCFPERIVRVRLFLFLIGLSFVTYGLSAIYTDAGRYFEAEMITFCGAIYFFLSFLTYKEPIGSSLSGFIFLLGFIFFCLLYQVEVLQNQLIWILAYTFGLGYLSIGLFRNERFPSLGRRWL